MSDATTDTTTDARETDEPQRLETLNPIMDPVPKRRGYALVKESLFVHSGYKIEPLGRSKAEYLLILPADGLSKMLARHALSPSREAPGAYEIDLFDAPEKTPS